MFKYLSFISFFLIFTCTILAQKKNDSELNCVDFITHINSLENAHIFDLRMINLYEDSRINNAIWAGTKESFEPFLLNLNRDTPIFLYCQFGKRTKQCVVWLNSKGFYKVYQLKGGLEKWIKNGYPVDSEKIKK